MTTTEGGTVRRLPVGEGARGVSAEICVPEGYAARRDAGLVLAHGAGGDMHHEFVTYFFEAIGRRYLTMRFNFPYREAGRKAPDGAPRLEVAYRAALERLREAVDVAPRAVFAGGKSMGGRIATHLAAAGEDLAGLVLLGYPLHPPGKPEARRDRHLPGIRCPMLFIQGTRDRLCDLELLHRALEPLQTPWHVHVIEDGDHSFNVPKRAGRSVEDVRAEIRDVVTGWMQSTLTSA